MFSDEIKKMKTTKSFSFFAILLLMDIVLISEISLLLSFSEKV